MKVPAITLVSTSNRRLNMADVFDEIEKIVKPLHPRTFNLITPRDLRKAIAEIVADLEKL